MPRRKRKRLRKNIKIQNAGGFFPRPLAVILVLATVIGLNFLWLHSRCVDLGKSIKALEKKKRNLEEFRQHEEFKWCRMKTPKNVIRTLRRYNIKMEWPDESRIVWITEGNITKDRAEKRTLLAQRINRYY